MGIWETDDLGKEATSSITGEGLGYSWFELILIVCGIFLAFAAFGKWQFEKQGLTHFPWEQPPLTAKQLKQAAKREAKREKIAKRRAS